MAQSSFADIEKFVRNLASNQKARGRTVKVEVLKNKIKRMIEGY